MVTRYAARSLPLWGLAGFVIIETFGRRVCMRDVRKPQCINPFV